MPDPREKKQKRVHPDERPRVKALNEMATILHGAPEQKSELSYYSPILIQCTLPHSDPKTPSWAKKNGNAALVISSGFDKNGKAVGVPYGSLPRLVLAYIITRVIQSGGEVEIKLEAHFGSFLREIGYIGNLRGRGRAAQSVQNQMQRLVKASINIEGREGDAEQGGIAGENIQIAKRYAMWWDYNNPEQGTLWGSFIKISEEFRNEILKVPVPLRTDILASLKKSPLALDVYMWVSYRLFAMQRNGHDDISLSYGRLQVQFGTGIADKNYRQFRKELKLAFDKVAAHWLSPDGKKQKLHYEFGKDRLTLYRSPLLVAKDALPALRSNATSTVITVKDIDPMTYRQARKLAGNLDIDFIARQYVEWLRQEQITPKNLRSHFLAFVKTHRERNAEAE